MFILLCLHSRVFTSCCRPKFICLSLAKKTLKFNFCVSLKSKCTLSVRHLVRRIVYYPFSYILILYLARLSRLTTIRLFLFVSVRSVTKEIGLSNVLRFLLLGVEIAQSGHVLPILLSGGGKLFSRVCSDISDRRYCYFIVVVTGKPYLNNSIS